MLYTIKHWKNPWIIRYEGIIGQVARERKRGFAKVTGLKIEQLKAELAQLDKAGVRNLITGLHSTEEFVPGSGSGSEQNVDSGVGEGEQENRVMRYGPVTNYGGEVLLLQFCSVKKDDRERWWLR
ncbi:unnamed protein product [Sphenostylis stenocarpa]|uniref:Uncharacterized protein n=1 Tax=Sphenostylis stenocarpa TaxID=92480 RepID=A0AA86RWE7_9FABA|nr:unnamed protein product [Sphenostylis stenocarpa]CAJ1932305.1 unnamed protein product [Sphenostylis stenocarpa]